MPLSSVNSIKFHLIFDNDMQISEFYFIFFKEKQKLFQLEM